MYLRSVSIALYSYCALKQTDLPKDKTKEITIFCLEIDIVEYLLSAVMHVVIVI